MKESAIHYSSTSRAAQGDAGKHAVSLHAPVMQQQPVAQLNNPKKSILPPQDEQLRSKIVPDLSVFMVDAIVNAKSKEERLEVLLKLFDYLSGMGAVESPRTLILYEDRVHEEGHYANTWWSGENDNDPLQITFFKTAFELGPAALYSIFRHELIHVSQRSKVPRSEEEGGVEAEDKFMHENLYEDYVGKDTGKTFQIPMMEIETHVWELHHSYETGVIADKKYIEETIKELTIYATTLSKSVDKEPKRRVMYWQNYIINAIKMLKSLGLEKLDIIAEKIAQDLEKQRQKKDSKNAGSKRQKKNEELVEVVEEVEIEEIDLEDQVDAQTVNSGKQVEDKGWIFKTYSELSYPKVNVLGLKELQEMMKVNMERVPKTWKEYYTFFIQRIEELIIQHEKEGTGEGIIIETNKKENEN